MNFFGRVAVFLYLLAGLLFSSVSLYALEIPSLGKYQKTASINGVITIPLSKVSDGKVHFFSVDDDGKRIAFFLVKGSDGALHSAFDACDVCYKEKKGYKQQEDYVICNNCKMKFPVNKIGSHSTGGCNPSFLPCSVDGKNVLIRLSDLKTGARFF